MRYQIKFLILIATLFVVILLAYLAFILSKKETPLSPNYDERPASAQIDMLIIHYTVGDLSDTLKVFQDPVSGVSSHYLIAKDGTVIEVVPEHYAAHHAGVSYWQGRLNLNTFSIGIELENSGDEPYPQVQMDALETLASNIIRRYCILPENVLGHSDIASMRREDPGVLFDWHHLAAKGIGLWPENFDQIDPEKIADTSVANVQDLLSQYGYAVPRHGQMDAYTQSAIEAFQRHFYPEKAHGQIDPETVSRLQQVLRIIRNEDSAPVC